MTGRVLLLNGPPSSGKTSLVNALQQEIAEPWFHLSLDDFRSGFSETWWTADDGRLFDQVMSGYVGSMREMALAGNDVLSEVVISPDRRHLYERSYGELAIVLIGVRCPIDVAVQREKLRSDRRRGPIDLNPHEYAAVHSGLRYDVEVSTTSRTPNELAVELVKQLEGITPSSFAGHVL